MYYWISAYFVIYYTDTVGIPMAAVSLLTLVVRIFDAFNDPIIGSIADRTKSRWGRYRPWFMIGSIVMAILIVLQFACNPNWSMTLRLVWMWVVYVLLTVASTCSNMPYGAMNACITPDATDRAKTGGLRMMFANVASMLTLIIAVPLITSLGDGTATSARGFFLAVLVTCLIGLPTMVISCWRTKEVIEPPPTQDTIPMKAQMKSLFKNRGMIILVICHFMMGAVYYGRATMLAYYWAYNCGNAGLASTYGWVSLAGAFIGATWVGSWLLKLIPHKGRVCALLNILCAVAYLVMYWIPAPSVGFWILSLLAALLFGAYMGVHYGTMGDAIDYGELISGVRCDGFLASFTSLAMKCGGAVGPAAGGALLAALNYVANTQQTPQVLNAINLTISVIPCAICVVNAILYLFYPISQKKHKEIMDELIRRRTVTN